MSETASAGPRGRLQTVATAALAAGVLLAFASVSRTDSFVAQAGPDAVAPGPPIAQTATAQPVETRTPAVVREAPPAGPLLQQHLDERYGPRGAGAAWHVNVRGVAMRFGTVVVQTDLADGPEAGEKATAIGQAVLGFQGTSWGRQMSGLVVEVYGQGGRLLAQDRVMTPTPTPVMELEP